MEKNSKSNRFKYPHSIATCVDSYNTFCFKIPDKVISNLDIKIKKDLHINWGNLT